QNGRIDFSAVVAGPGAYFRLRTVESGRVARGKETRKPFRIIDELDIVLLGYDLRSGFLPERYSADMVGMAMRQDNVFHRPVVFRDQQLPGLRGHLRQSSIDYYISGRRSYHKNVAGRGSHIDTVPDLNGLCLILTGGICVNSGNYAQRKRDNDDSGHSFFSLYKNSCSVLRSQFR